MSNNVVCPYCDGGCDKSACPKFLAYKKVQEPNAIKEMLESLSIDPNKDSLSVMMDLQKAFAVKFHPVEGLEKSEIEYWVKAYDICISDEHAEVLEHLSLIMDNEPKEDLYELQKEFIDIWHFLMDQFLVAKLTSNKLVELYCEKYGVQVDKNNPLKSVFINEYNKLNEKYNGQLNGLSKSEVELAILVHANKLLLAKSKVMNEISWKHWKKPSDSLNYEKLHSALMEVFVSLVKCFILTGLDDNKLYEIYTVKNAENHYRQTFGY